MPSIEPALVSVVIVNYNGAHHLDDCLDSLKAQTYPRIEIAVIDNGSTDNSAEVCRRHGIEFVFTGGNIGLASAYNFGVRRSRGQFAFVANNDIWVAPDCIERLVGAMNRNGEKCFATDPKQYNWDRSQVIHYCPAMRPLHRLRELVSVACSVFPLVGFTYVQSEEESPVRFASGGAMLVRRPLFDAIGGFDQTFFTDWEDVDLCWRANRRGWPSIYVPSAWIRHKWNATCSQYSNPGSPIGRKMAISQQHNMIRFALKNYDAINAASFVALRCAVNLLMPLRPRRPHGSAGLVAMGKVLRTLPEILRLRRVERRSAVVSNRALFRKFCIHHDSYATVWPVEGMAPGASQTSSSSEASTYRG